MFGWRRVPLFGDVEKQLRYPDIAPYYTGSPLGFMRGYTVSWPGLPSLCAGPGLHPAHLRLRGRAREGAREAPEHVGNGRAVSPSPALCPAPSLLQSSVSNPYFTRYPTQDLQVQARCARCAVPPLLRRAVAAPRPAAWCALQSCVAGSLLAPSVASCAQLQGAAALGISERLITAYETAALNNELVSSGTHALVTSFVAFSS